MMNAHVGTGVIWRVSRTNNNNTSHRAASEREHWHPRKIFLLGDTKDDSKQDMR